MDAAGLVEKWIKEQYELEGDMSKPLEEWIKSNFSSYDSDNPALSYARAFARRHPSPVERQREIEIICARGEPAYGYATLAQLLSHDQYGRYCNTVLTTNFDDLIADALYLYGERHARPLVVTHEALARYVRTNSPRPTIVKLHGDAHIDPKNLQPETRELDIELCNQLYPFIQDHALVFIGYGGNDESVLKFVQNCPVPALAPPIFWISKREAPPQFHAWLCERDALRVDHTDFDQLMHLIRNALNIDLIDRKRWGQIGDRYYEAFETLKDQIEKLGAGSEDAVALKIATTEVEKTLPNDWHYVARAQGLEKINPEDAEKTYLEGLQNYPGSRRLNSNFADFLGDRNELDRADMYWKRAIEADPNHAVTLAAYARYLRTSRKDLDAAELYHKRAAEVMPPNAYAHTAYANFLEDIRNDMNAAETYFKRAIDIDPNFAHGLIHYARFLRKVRQDMDGAELYYKRAVEADPKHAYSLSEYALFLQYVRQDMDAAEGYFKRAIEVRPDYSFALAEYAQFLQNVRKDMDAAETFFKRAIEGAPESDSMRLQYDTFMAARRASTAQ